MDQEIKELEKKIAILSADNISIREQLIALQAVNKRTRLAWIYFCLPLFFCLFFAFPKKTFSGRWLAIHDEKENIRGWWDQDGFEIKDKGGIVRAKLSLFSDGSPYLQFYDQKHHLRSQLFVYSDGSSYLMLWDKDGKGVRFPPSKTPLR